MNPNKKMAINTVILYTNLIVTIAVNLYSTRLILNALGVDDYGIVNLISGIVAMLSFVQNSMTVSIQRFLSVNLGRGDLVEQKIIFNSSIALHMFLAIVLTLILELLVPMIFNSSVQIPTDRVSSAMWLYQLTILGTIFMILGVPYGATLNAHEDMLVYALISIAESGVRLMGAIYLLTCQYDRLIIYGTLIVLIRFLSTLLVFFYCRTHYSEARLRFNAVKWSNIKEMFMFSFWNMFGSFAITCRYQGVGIVMNTFLGVAVNAAFGIANQIAGQLSNFAATMNKAMAPQIMQRAGAGNHSSMISLAIKQCRYSSFLLCYVIIPLFICMNYVLTVWLGQIPENCVVFCQIMLIVAVVQQMTIGIQSAIQATGVIKKYQMTISLILVLNIPFAYLLLHLGLAPSIVVLGILFIECLCVLVRLLFAKRLAGLSIMLYLHEIVIPILFIYLISGVGIYIYCQCNYGTISTFRDLVCITTISLLATLLMNSVFLSRQERLLISKVVTRLLRR